MAKLIGHIVGMFIVSALFSWYNYVWWVTSVPYLALLVLSAIALWMVSVHKELGVFFGVLFFVSFSLQVLKWFSVVSLPMFK